MGPAVYYMDASRTSSDTFTVVSTCQNNVTTASFKTSSACVAEAAAIALAIQDAERQTHSAVILSDSQAACRLFLNGMAPQSIIKILGNRLEGHHTIIQCPAHETGRECKGRPYCSRIKRPSNGRAQRRPSTKFSGHPFTAKAAMETFWTSSLEFEQPTGEGLASYSYEYIPQPAPPTQNTPHEVH